MKIWYENKEIEVERICSKITSYKKGQKKPFGIICSPNEHDLGTASDYCLIHLFDRDKEITRIIGEVFVETKTERFPVRTFLIKWDKSGNRVCTVVDKSIEK